jgi:hypothetical protein
MCTYIHISMYLETSENGGGWSENDKQTLKELYVKYGPDWSKIGRCIYTYMNLYVYVCTICEIICI